MTVAELMVKIRISAEGAEKLQKADKDLKAAAQSAKGFGTEMDKAPRILGKTTKELKDMESWALRTSLKLDALAASLLYVVDTAMRGAAQLTRFTLATGIPTAALQGLQSAGAGGGITPEEMAGFVTSLQTAGVQMQMTGAGVGPWSLLQRLLGLPIDPRMDPTKLIPQLHQALMKLRPDQVPFARVIAGQAGIPENIFAALRNPRFNLTEFQQIYNLTQRNLGSMNDLNAEWGQLKYNLSATKNAFVSEFAPAINSAVQSLASLLGYFARFVEWLDRGSVGAQIMKYAIESLGVALGISAVAITAFVGALGAAAVAAGLLNIALLPEIAIGAALGAVIWGLVEAYEALVGAKNQNAGAFSPGGGGGFSGHGAGGAWEPAAGAPGLSGGGFDMAQYIKGASGGSTSITQTNQISVNGDRDPQRTSSLTVDKLKSWVNGAALAAPAPTR